jgi:hypothetical protein
MRAHQDVYYAARRTHCPGDAPDLTELYRLAQGHWSGSPCGGLVLSRPTGELDEVLVQLEPDAVVAVDAR